MESFINNAQRTNSMPLKIKSTKWDLSPLYSEDEDSKMPEDRKIAGQKSYEFINKWKNRKDYLENPAILKEALDEYEKWQANWGSGGKEGYYFHLRQSQDMNSPVVKAKLNKLNDFSNKIENDIQFFYLNIAKIPEDKQRFFLAYKGLENYRHFLEMIFANSKHLLSDAEEKIMNLKSSTSYSNWVRMTAGFLAKEEREVKMENGSLERKNFSEIASLLSSKNKETRDSANEGFNNILLKFAEVAEAEINSVLENKKVDDELRKMERPDSARHISDDIESSTADVLIKAVSSRFDVSKKYYELKAKLLGVDKLKYHERSVEYGSVDKKYKYEEAVEIVHRVLSELDEEFGNIFAMFIENGQIDAFPEKGKRGGAFCMDGLITQPTYILLNHAETLNDVLTIAHETGHGINNELMRKKQNALNFGTPLSTAEVASTFMEDFVLQSILRNADDEMKLAVMMAKLNADISTVFRQIACYMFEQELHIEFRKKGYLSKEEIGKLFQKHMEDYMGDYVEQSEGSENWWIYWQHIRSFFYNYSYANGLLISKGLQSSVRKNKEFAGKVKEFLSAGTSNSPKNIFMKTGIDITDEKFWHKGILEVEALLDETEELAKKLGKI